MARLRHVGEAAPAVGNLLVLGERVGDQREQPQVLLEGLGQRLGRGLALLRIRVLHDVQRLLERQRLAADLEAQRHHGFVEQPVERGIAGHRLLVEQLLDAVFELVRLVLADVLDPGPVMAERGIGHSLVQRRVIEPVQVEREEQEVQRGRGDAFLHVAVELGDGGIGGVAGIEQPGIGDQSAEHVLDRLVAAHRLAERAARIGACGDVGEPALVGLLELEAFGLAALEVALDLRRIHRRIKVDQIPFRQRTERFRRLVRRSGARGGVKLDGCHENLAVTEFGLPENIRPPAHPASMCYFPSTAYGRCRRDIWNTHRCPLAAAGLCWRCSRRDTGGMG